jgi:hypothetical protein
MERKKMFPMDHFEGKFFFIPNYPSPKVIQAVSEKSENWNNNKYLKVIYPGSPSAKNGFEELINAMSELVNGKQITLTIVGETNEKYRKELNDYAILKGVEKQLFFEDRVPYTEMPKFLSNYHIGWAMYKPQDMRTATVATASNKIYEFLANAMPIVVYDNEHHRTHLSDTAATFFSNLTEKNIHSILEQIDLNYKQLSSDAMNEFKDKYQFELAFNKAMEDILE